MAQYLSGEPATQQGQDITKVGFYKINELDAPLSQLTQTLFMELGVIPRAES